MREQLTLKSAESDSSSSEPLPFVAAIGAKVRSLRKARQMTMDDLSKAAGISQSMLSLIERGRASASIGTLYALAGALGTKASDLLVDMSGENFAVVIPAKNQPILEVEPGVTWREVRRDRARGVEIIINEFEPGTGSTLSPMRHTGYEYGLLLKGELQAEIDGVQYLLKEGDTVAYSSLQDHKIWNESRRPAAALWIIVS